MKLSTSLSMWFLCGSIASASSLAVYQDNTYYSFTPKSQFLGLTKNVKAKCEGNTLPLSVSTVCPSEERVCQLLNDWKEKEQRVEEVQENRKVLQKLISLPQTTTVEADLWIEAAKRLGNEEARLIALQRVLGNEAKISQQEFQRQAPSIYALQTSKECGKEVEVTLPRGYLSFSTYYEADTNDEKEVTVTQYLSVTNRSGIDIHADSAMFFYRSAHQYLQPVHFRPWIVSKYEPLTNGISKTAMAKRKSMDMAMVSEEMMSPSVMDSAPLVSYEDAREYKIQDLSLPSNGVPLDVKVLSWSNDLSCELRAYPYENTNAFHVCSFEPKYQIDSNHWKVRSSGEMINENAVGEYKGGKYDLYIKSEEDLTIQRRRIVNKERETGIFGGTVRKKDGFRLSLTNKSDRVKNITIIERIPTSTTEEIKSKLLSISSEEKVNYTMLKEGEIEMKITLNPNENRKIEVLFEISHAKDMKVNY